MLYYSSLTNVKTAIQEKERLVLTAEFRAWFLEEVGFAS